MMADNMLNCTMCPFSTINERVLTNHYVRTHQFDDRFYVMCNVNNCGATYKRWKSYKMHVYRKHRANADVMFADDELLINGEAGNQYGNEVPGNEVPGNEDNLNDEDPWERAQLEAVKFILYIRDSCKTSDVARGKVMEGTRQLMHHYLSLFMGHIERQADPQTRMVSLDAVQPILSEAMPVGELFSKVDTKSKLDDFLVENFNMIIPHEVELGKAWVWKRRPRVDLVEETRKGYTIPLLDGLKRLLANDQVRSCVDNPQHSPGVMKSVLDGAYYKNHPFFSQNMNSLAIILYYDEVEVVNPLGSRTHKLGMFYWCLANIYPELRSSFNAINLLGVARYCDIKNFGIDKMLRSFVDDINELQTNGVSITVNGVQRTFKGSLLFVTADTPAAALLGGFKQSVSATKPCRRCMTNQDQLKTYFSEIDFTLRTMETHLNHVEAVNTPHLQVLARNFWRQLNGVNGGSSLLEIDGFDITKCLVQDAMHVLSEGCLEVETREFLKWCIANGAFSLPDFNEKMLLFDLGHLSKNKPAKILPQHLNNNLRQSAAQMVCLSHLTPFIVRDLVRGEIRGTDIHRRLTCHNLLLQVTNICFAFEVTNNDADFLQNVIRVFLQKFTALYPDAMVPKFHFLLHMPNQIRLFGPLRQQWCMRFEAVHAWFKSVARVIRSVKNVPWSLCYRYESLRCAQLYSAPNTQSTCFLSTGDLISEGTDIPLRELQQPHQDLLIPLLLNVDVNECHLLSTPKVIVYGTKYLVGSLVLLSCDGDNMPTFGKISNIYVHDRIIHLVALPYETVRFSYSLNAYNIRVDAEAQLCAIRLKDLSYPHELSIYHLRGEKYVILFNHTRTEFV